VWIRVEVGNGDSSTETLPVRALNDVFIAEKHPFKTSYYEFVVGGGEPEFHKSSGLIIATGTGSTAWSYSDARIRMAYCESILRLAEYPEDKLTPELVKRVTDAFNKQLVFPPTDMNMLYVVRAPIFNETTNIRNTLGFSSRIQVRSRSWDACLTIDANHTVEFNDGRSAWLSLLPEDQLRCPLLFVP
jgi:NAD+ kinase